MTTATALDDRALRLPCPTCYVRPGAECRPGRDALRRTRSGMHIRREIRAGLAELEPGRAAVGQLHTRRPGTAA